MLPFTRSCYVFQTVKPNKNFISYSLRKERSKIETLNEVLTSINLLEEESNKLSKDKKTLMLELQKVCPHDDITDFFDYDYPHTYHYRYCKLCKKDLL